jgi:hypothetical protein
VEEPQNFLRSLITLKDGLDFFHKDFSLPLTSAYVEESVRDIKNAISPQPISSKDPNLTSPTFVPHLNLALWTLGELLKDDAQRNLDLAKRKNHELISVLRGPEDSEEADALLSPEGNRPALSPLPPILPDPPLVPLDAKPFQSCISIKTASCLLDAWLFLAKGFIRPGDLLWTPYEEYPTLLEGKLEPFPGHPEIFIYADL